MTEIPEYVKSEIYLITNKTTKKQYVGQTRTHALNHGKYRKFGSHKRWQAHVSEAFGNYKNQSRYLNNAIRKYGADDFNVEIIYTCTIYEANYYEIFYIKKYDTFNNGYNLTEGGDNAIISDAQKKDISNTLKSYYNQKKLERFRDKVVSKSRFTWRINNNIHIISVYSTIENYENTGKSKTIKTDFGGKLCPFKESVDRAVIFALQLVSKDNIDIHETLKEHIDFNNYEEKIMGDPQPSS